LSCPQLVHTLSTAQQIVIRRNGPLIDSEKQLSQSAGRLYPNANSGGTTISLSFDSLKYRFRTVISSSGLVTAIADTKRNFIQKLSVHLPSPFVLSRTHTNFSISVTDDKFVLFVRDFAPRLALPI
jgi:hypothetical protein